MQQGSKKGHPTRWGHQPNLFANVAPTFPRIDLFRGGRGRKKEGDQILLPLARHLEEGRGTTIFELPRL